MNIFWGYCVFFGLSFAVAEESSRSDINRYESTLVRYHSLDQMTLDELKNDFDESGEVDVFKTYFLFFISRLTDSRSILTFSIAIVFGFFYSRNTWYLLGRLEGKITPLQKILFIVLILIVPIWNINSFRMWLAFHMFMYGILPYLVEKKKNQFPFIFLSFFVHFSFILPIITFLIYFIFGDRIKFYFVFFVISFFLTNMDINVINDFVGQFSPENIEQRSEVYRSEEKVNELRNYAQEDSRTWYVRWNKDLFYWTLGFLIVFFYIKRLNIIRKDTILLKLFSFNLMLFGVSNLLINIPSGRRYFTFSSFITIIFLIFYLNRYPNDLNVSRLLVKFTPIFVLFIVVYVRIGLYYLSVTSIFGNPIVAALVLGQGDFLSLNDLIK